MGSFWTLHFSTAAFCFVRKAFCMSHFKVFYEKSKWVRFSKIAFFGLVPSL